MSRLVYPSPLCYGGWYFAKLSRRVARDISFLLMDCEMEPVNPSMTFRWSVNRSLRDGG